MTLHPNSATVSAKQPKPVAATPRAALVGEGVPPEAPLEGPAVGSLAKARFFRDLASLLVINKFFEVC